MKDSTVQQTHTWYLLVMWQCLLIAVMWQENTVSRDSALGAALWGTREDLRAVTRSENALDTRVRAALACWARRQSQKSHLVLGAEKGVGRPPLTPHTVCCLPWAPAMTRGDSEKMGKCELCPRWKWTASPEHIKENFSAQMHSRELRCLTGKVLWEATCPHLNYQNISWGLRRLAVWGLSRI